MHLGAVLGVGNPCLHVPNGIWAYLSVTLIKMNQNLLEQNDWMLPWVLKVFRSWVEPHSLQLLFSCSHFSAQQCICTCYTLVIGMHTYWQHGLLGNIIYSLQPLAGICCFPVMLAEAAEWPEIYWICHAQETKHADTCCTCSIKLGAWCNPDATNELSSTYGNLRVM